MRFFLVAGRVLEEKELCLDEAVLEVKKATGEEIDVSMQQGPSGKSCKHDMSRYYCHFDCHIAKVIYFRIFSVKG